MSRTKLGSYTAKQFIALQSLLRVEACPIKCMFMLDVCRQNRKFYGKMWLFINMLSSIIKNY